MVEVIDPNNSKSTMLLFPELICLSLHPLSNFLKAFSSLFEERVLIKREGKVVL